MVNKKIVIICTLIALIVILSIIGFKIKIWKENYEELDAHAETNLENNMINSTVNETNETNEINETENETSENSVTNETVDNQNTFQGVEEINGNESYNNSEEEAILLAKKEWGETDETVYYTVDNVSENIYTISVRSKSSTAQLAEYEVNLATKEVTIK